jgi:LmbE family N-acetylglucosaminyl deacetylase
MSELNKVAMVVVAHEDDFEFGGAGTAALWIKDGWDVYLVVCTDGGAGGPDDATDVSPQARQRTIEVREQEQLAAASILGLKEVIFLDYPDGELQPTIELRRTLVRLLRRYRPARVICQSPDRSWTPSLSLYRYHPDHMAAGQATLAALYPAAQNPWDFPELMGEGLLPHKVSEIYITLSPVVNHVVDITTTIELKLKALRAHSSQLGNHADGLDQLLRSIDAQQGEAHGYAYAEIFHRIEH